jgi:hypothetical protein
MYLVITAVGGNKCVALSTCNEFANQEATSGVARKQRALIAALNSKFRRRKQGERFDVDRVKESSLLMWIRHLQHYPFLSFPLCQKDFRCQSNHQQLWCLVGQGGRGEEGEKGRGERGGKGQDFQSPHNAQHSATQHTHSNTYTMCITQHKSEHATAQILCAHTWKGSDQVQKGMLGKANALPSSHRHVLLNGLNITCFSRN